MNERIRGLYAITPDRDDTHRLLADVEAALKGGACLVQYRNKGATPDLRLEQAAALRALCARHQVPLIINDDPALCLQVDAHGVHLGRADGDAVAARALLGSGRIIGVSCYDNMAAAQIACANGADYIAFGSCFGSATKPKAPRAELALFGKARPLGIATVAIGGITVENAGLAIAAGADAVAVISNLWQAPDIRQAARDFSNLFTGH